MLATHEANRKPQSTVRQGSQKVTLLHHISNSISSSSLNAGSLHQSHIRAEPVEATLHVMLNSD